MVLVEEGLINLNKPVQQYLAKPLPEYPGYADLAGDSRYRTVTAAQVLLGHHQRRAICEQRWVPAHRVRTGQPLQLLGRRGRTLAAWS